MKKEKIKGERLLLLSVIILVIPTILTLISLIELIKSPRYSPENWILIIPLCLYIFILILSVLVKRSLAMRKDLPEDFREKYQKNIYSFEERLKFIGSFLILFNIWFHVPKSDRFYLLWLIPYITGITLLLLVTLLDWFKKKDKNE